MCIEDKMDKLEILNFIENEIKEHKVKIKSMGFGESRRFCVEWKSALENLLKKLEGLNETTRGS